MRAPKQIALANLTCLLALSTSDRQEKIETAEH